VARRLLLTLAHLGFVATDGKLYWLTPRVLRLGHGYLQSSRLARAVQPFLQRITSATGEPAYLAVLDGDEVVTIARNGPQAALNTGYVLGARVPARLTATGQVLLAAQAPQALDDWLATTDLTPRTPFTQTGKTRLRQTLASIREQGWALSEQQLAPGQRGVAVPLLGPAGRRGGGAGRHPADAGRKRGRGPGPPAAPAAGHGAGGTPRPLKPPHPAGPDFIARHVQKTLGKHPFGPKTRRKALRDGHHAGLWLQCRLEAMRWPPPHLPGPSPRTAGNHRP
jgi:DNA-binding IclR family transcriptional regulator